jgi:holo-[acyl-carrier protein] synthase
MILGVGVEWIDVPRFRALLARRSGRVRERLFTPGELAYAARRRRGEAESLAVRFAAKVAARRALGAPGVSLREIEVVRPRGSAPTLQFHGAAAAAAQARAVGGVALTLTHDALACIGQVVLERAR